MAQIKALEQQKRQLQVQERTQLRKTEAQFKAHVEGLHRQKGAMTAAHKEKLVLEKALTVKRIQERFAYIRKYDGPLQVWGQLDQNARTLQGVYNSLRNANPDYGGNRAAAVRSLGQSVADLQNRLSTHRWLRGEREGTVQNLRAAEVDLQNALAYSASKWGLGTPKGMPQSGRLQSAASQRSGHD